MATRRAQAAFTIVELAVVMAIIGLLLAGAMMTLTAQAEQRALDETRRRLNAAVDALVAYAVVNGRLPCPANPAGAAGEESPNTGTGICTNPYNGLLPARTIGFQPTDDAFFGLDAWQNRIRYVVAGVTLAPDCGGVGGAMPHFTVAATLKTNGMSCKPNLNDLDVVCSSVGAGVSPSCNSSQRVVAQQTAAFIVYSIGKNGPNPGAYGADETANLDNNAVFVNRTWSGTDSPLGTYDDLMVVVPAGVLYSRLVAAGVLP
jgi:prepilin-type N-terminal cleavage/methylation domain-containing protein